MPEGKADFVSLGGKSENILPIDADFARACDGFYGLGYVGGRLVPKVRPDSVDGVMKGFREVLVAAESWANAKAKAAAEKEYTIWSIIKQAVGGDPESAPFVKMLDQVRESIRVLDGKSENLEVLRSVAQQLYEAFLLRLRRVYEEQAELKEGKEGLAGDVGMVFDRRVDHARKLTDVIKNWRGY